MFLNTRRFSVWLVSFLMVMVIYFIYNRVSRTPRIIPAGRDSGQRADSISESRESPAQHPFGEAGSASSPPAGVGKLGQVGIEAVKNVRYTKLDANKQVVGEFGFEELLHKDGNDWEIEEPYYTIYRRGFKCTIRGDRARVTVETSGGKVTPRQGLLTGNVTIRIEPKNKEGLGDATVYLDDIFFVGEKSMFSTTGMVEVVSRDVRLVGMGMELIYDGDAERLDLLKIKRLENLSIKRWSRGTVLSTKPSAGGEGGRDEQKTEKTGQRYRCVLENNVVIETLKERLAAEIVSINNIFVAGGPDDEPNTQTTGKSAADKQQAGQTSGVTRSATGGSGTPVVEEAGDVVIRSDGGVVITPAQHPLREMDSVADRGIEVTETRCGDAIKSRTGGKATLCAGRIDYDAATGEAVAPGLSQIAFDSADANQKKPAVVTITSRKELRYEPALNQISFEGGCRCTVTQEDGNTTRQYFVLADKLEMNLTRKQSPKGQTTLDVERLAALGGDVHLASTKKAVRPGSPQAGERLLTGVELKCARADYNVVSGDFLATGPGLIKFDNSQTDEPQKGLGRFSLRRKCYAILQNFNTLEFNGGAGRLVADSNGGSLLADYILLLDDGGVEKVDVTASRVEADILESAGGRKELGALKAGGAVTYKDKETNVQGSSFVYDSANGEITVTGDRSVPARFNDVPIDSAQYNVKTGKWRTKITGPGAVK